LRVAIDGLLLGGQHSGVELCIEELAGALGRLDLDCEIGLVCRPEYSLRAAKLGVEPLVAPWLTKYRSGRILFEQLLMSRRLSSSGWGLLHGPGYVLPRNWTGPCVVTVYDLIALQYPQWCKPSNVMHYRMMVPASIAKAHAIIVPSETTAEAVRQRFPQATDKLRVIFLGIGEQFRPVTDQRLIAHVRQKYRLPERFILCLGNLEPKKNLEAVVAAYEQIAEDVEVDLVIAGAKGWKCAGVLRRIEGSRVRARIVRTGPIAGTDLAPLYSSAELLIQWSLYEGVGLPPLEAMACGTPALVSDGGALKELAGQAAEVVELGPPEQLAEAIVRLLDDKDRCEQIVENGRNLARQWTWRDHARQVAALYREVAGA